MRELMILIEYKLKMWSHKSRRRSKKKGTSIPTWILLVIVAVGLVGAFTPITMLLVKTFTALKSMHLPGTHYPMSEVLLGMFGFMIMVMLLLNDVPSIIYNVVSENEETSLLFSLPIKRSVVFFFKIFEVISGTALPILFFFPFLIAYAISVKMAWYLVPIYILDIAALILLLMGIASVIAAFVARFMSSTTAKRLNIIMYTISIIFLVFIFNLLPGRMTTGNPLPWMKRYVSLATDPFLPSTWFLGAVKFKSLYLTLLYGTCVLSMLGLWALSSRYSIDITKVGEKRREKRVSITTNRNVFGPFVSKDLKLLFREGNVLFLFLYPLIFPLIMLFTGSWSIVGATLFAGFLCMDYCAMIAGGLSHFENQAYPMSVLLPVSEKRIIFEKALISSAIYSSLYVLAILIALFIAKKGWMLLLNVPFTFVALFEMSIYGVISYLASPREISADFQSAMKGMKGLKMMLISTCITAGVILSSVFGLDNSFKIPVFFKVLLFPVAPSLTIIVFWYLLKDRLNERYLKGLFENR